MLLQHRVNRKLLAIQKQGETNCPPPPPCDVGFRGTMSKPYLLQAIVELIITSTIRYSGTPFVFDSKHSFSHGNGLRTFVMCPAACVQFWKHCAEPWVFTTFRLAVTVTTPVRSWPIEKKIVIDELVNYDYENM